jgi:hygromycin-B 7''-O-kinase
MTWTAPTPLGNLRESAPLAHWVAAGREILARHGLHGEPTLAPTGSDVVLDAGDVFIKLTLPVWSWQIEREAECARLFAGRLPAAAPRLVATGALGGWPYVVTSRVPGVPIASVWPGLADAERVLLASEIGATVGALRGIPTASDSGAAADAWRAFLADVEGNRDARQRGLGVPEARIDEARERLRHAASARDASLVWLHTELLGEHLFVDRDATGWRLTGVIDWADARVGHPDYEVAALVEFVFRGARGCLEAFLEAVGEARPDADRRAALFAWALRHRYLHLERLRRAAGGPATLRETEERLYG